MDRLTAVVSFAGTLALLVIGEGFRLHDFLTGGGPDAELRRFLELHPDAKVYHLER